MYLVLLFLLKNIFNFFLILINQTHYKNTKTYIYPPPPNANAILKPNKGKNEMRNSLVVTPQILTQISPLFIFWQDCESLTCYYTNTNTTTQHINPQVSLGFCLSSVKSADSPSPSTPPSSPPLQVYFPFDFKR